MKQRLSAADERVNEAVRREERALGETRRFLKQLRTALRRAAVLDGECKTAKLDLSQSRDEIASLRRTVAMLRKRAGSSAGAAAVALRAAPRDVPVAAPAAADRRRPAWQSAMRNSSWGVAIVEPARSSRSPAHSPARAREIAPQHSPPPAFTASDAAFSDALERGLAPYVAAVDPDVFEAVADDVGVDVATEEHIDALLGESAEGRGLSIRELVNGARALGSGAGGSSVAPELEPEPAQRSQPRALRSAALERVDTARRASGASAALPSPLESEVAKQLKVFRAALERSLGVSDEDVDDVHGGGGQHRIASALFRSAAHLSAAERHRGEERFRSAALAAVDAAAKGTSQAQGSQLAAVDAAAKGSSQAQGSQSSSKEDTGVARAPRGAPAGCSRSDERSPRGATAAELKGEIEREMSSLQEQFGVVF
jgi:hypothetical protein